MQSLDFAKLRVKIELAFWEDFVRPRVKIESQHIIMLNPILHGLWKISYHMGGFTEPPLG